MSHYLSVQSQRIVFAIAAKPKRQAYGMELMSELGMESGSLYPMLYRLEQHGYVRGAWERKAPKTLGRPKRRVYVLTDAGQQYVTDQRRELRAIVSERMG